MNFGTVGPSELLVGKADAPCRRQTNGEANNELVIVCVRAANSYMIASRRS